MTSGARPITPELITSIISPPQKEAIILPLRLRKKITCEKNDLPGNELVDGANPAEKLHILIAQYVDCLRPQQQAGNQQNNDQNDPA